jgi:hypothetical protein
MDQSETAPVHDAASVVRLLDLSFHEEVLRTFGPPPDPQRGFVTFFDPGWSILELRASPSVIRRGVFGQQSWYDSEPFASLREPPAYRQLLMEPEEDMPGYPITELPQGEHVPSARVVITALVLHVLATGEPLLPDLYARCADETVQHGRVCVGHRGLHGLYLCCEEWIIEGHATTGLASARTL